MQETARLQGYAIPGDAEWQVMARWVVLMTEWPKTWYTLSHHPQLANLVLDSAHKTSELPKNTEKLAQSIRNNQAAYALLTFSQDERGWVERNITSEEIIWLRELMPPTSGRLLETSGESDSID